MNARIPTGNRIKMVVIQGSQYVVLVMIAVMTVVPILWAFASSCRTNFEIGRYMSPITWRTFIPQEFTIENYILLFTKFGFYKPFLNTMFVCVTTVFFGGLLCSLAGFAFSKYRFRFKTFLFGIVMLALMIPFEATAVPLFRLVFKLGLLDTYWALLLPAFANGVVVFMFKQFFDNIPDSLLEAARIDRAGTLRIYCQIVMPLSKPALISGGLILFYQQFNSFMWPLIAARTANMKVIQIALSDFNTEFNTNWALIYAAASISIIVPLMLLLPLQKYFIRGITTSGIKG